MANLYSTLAFSIPTCTMLAIVPGGVRCRPFINPRLAATMTAPLTATCTPMCLALWIEESKNSRRSLLGGGLSTSRSQFHARRGENAHTLKTGGHRSADQCLLTECLGYFDTADVVPVVRPVLSFPNSSTSLKLLLPSLRLLLGQRLGTHPVHFNRVGRLGDFILLAGGDKLPLPTVVAFLEQLPGRARVLAEFRLVAAGGRLATVVDADVQGVLAEGLAPLSSQRTALGRGVQVERVGVGAARQ